MIIIHQWRWIVTTEKNENTTVGVINPYALTEYTLGKKVTWKRKSPESCRATVEGALGVPYEKLFSPVHDSPLYRTPRSPQEGK
jgi:hypothetical protein